MFTIYIFYILNFLFSLLKNSYISIQPLYFPTIPFHEHQTKTQCLWSNSQNSSSPCTSLNRSKGTTQHLYNLGSILYSSDNFSFHRIPEFHPLSLLSTCLFLDIVRKSSILVVLNNLE